MVDPTKITNFDRTHSELEELILFCVCAAGHNAVSSAKALQIFLDRLDHYNDGSPFQKIKYLDRWPNYKDLISNFMKYAGIGCNSWKFKARTFYELATSNLDLKACSLEDLESIHGIGRKTSRFFMLHTRPNMQCAVLDTHILKHMRDKGYDVPKNTPASKKSYALIESQFLKLAHESGQSVADFDLSLWVLYSSRSKHKSNKV